MAMKHASRWAFVASSTDSTNSSNISSTSFAAALQLPVLTDGLKKTGPTVDAPYSMGIQQRVANRGRVPTESYGGTITLEASPECLDFFVPMMTGDTNATSTLQDTMTKQFDVICSDGAEVWTYRNCLITSWTLKGSTGGVCELSLDVVARSEAQGGGFASATFTTTTAADPYLVAEVGVTMGGQSPLDADDFELTVDRAVVVKNRFNLGPSTFLPGQRTVTFKTNTIWNATIASAFYAVGKLGVTGAAVTLSRTNLVFVVTTSKLVVNDTRPDTGGVDGELMYGFEGIAKGALPISGMTNEISITSDATP